MHTFLVINTLVQHRYKREFSLRAKYTRKNVKIATTTANLLHTLSLVHTHTTLSLSLSLSLPSSCPQQVRVPTSSTCPIKILKLSQPHRTTSHHAVHLPRPLPLPPPLPRPLHRPPPPLPRLTLIPVTVAASPAVTVHASASRAATPLTPFL